MFFWNINSLIQQIKANGISSYEQAQYYAATYLLMTFSYYSKASSINIFLIEGWVIPSIIAICGIAYCYAINKRIDNKDFLLRMIAINFVAATRYGVFMLVSNMSLSLLFYVVKYNPSGLYEIILNNIAIRNMLITALQLAYYWYIGKQFKKIDQSPESMVHEYHPSTTA